MNPENYENGYIIDNSEISRDLSNLPWDEFMYSNPIVIVKNFPTLRKHWHNHQCGIIINDKQTPSVIMSAGEYPEIDRYKVNNSWYTMDGKRKNNIVLAPQLNNINPRKGEIFIYSGMKKFSDVRNEKLADKVGQVIKYIINFGRGRKEAYITYVILSRYETINLNGKPRHVFYFSFIED